MAEFAPPESAWATATATVVVVAVCGAFVCACSGVVARRDVVDARGVPAPTPLPGDVASRVVRALEGVVVPPVIVGAWAAVLAAGVLVFAPTLDPVATALVALLVAATVRTVAYCSERLSRTVARILPFSLLGIGLLEGTPVRSLGTVADAVDRLAGHPRAVAFVLVGLLGVETVLRVVSELRRRVDG